MRARVYLTPSETVNSRIVVSTPIEWHYAASHVWWQHGRYLKNTNRASLSVTGGFAWQQIHYQQDLFPSSTQHLTSALASTQLNLFSYYVRLWRKSNGI